MPYDRYVPGRSWVEVDRVPGLSTKYPCQEFGCVVEVVEERGPRGPNFWLVHNGVKQPYGVVAEQLWKGDSFAMALADSLKAMGAALHPQPRKDEPWPNC